MKTTALALSCILAIGVSGCGGGHHKKPVANNAVPPTGLPTGMVQGRLVTVGGLEPGKPRPIAGTVTFKGPDGSVTKAEVDQTGKFAIGLYPGNYVIQGTSPLINDGKTTCSTAEPKVKLTAGKTVTADVMCSIK